MHSSTYSSPVGDLQITCSEEHILSILFASPETSAISIVSDHPLLHNCFQQLMEYFEGTRRDFDLPLQQTGTAFQSRVWTQLQNIRYGTTISYLQLARQLGDVKAIRAVGTANGKNNIAIVVPCHRVIGSNASLTGYAGGLWRKQWLLEHEAKFYAGVQQFDFGPVARWGT